MRITPAGNVGIGTPTSGQLLSVAGTIESTTGGFTFPDGTLQTSAARSSAGNNEAFGTLSLSQNTGQDNAAFGDYTLSANTTGYDNAASGAYALESNTTGLRNTASGYLALATSSGLLQLRPVTFHYKSDQNPAGRTLQYGLIAEEVAEVYPGLVARSADGQIETVLYQFLPPMLLNEVQKQQRTIDTLRAQVGASDVQMRARDAQIRTLTEQVEALTRAVAALRDRKQ